jgi:lipopolysaccharide transport system ATP-binding protein
VSQQDRAISVEHVAKRFAVGEREQYLALRDVIAGTAAKLVGKGASQSHTEHRWALEDVSFDVAPGEVLGLIGRNGAGKSTLLKLISSITRPTRGTVSVRGRVGTLLEVGSGFHPELTGSENIYLNGAILGMRRAEIRANFDQIVEFSGVEAYLDTPVKRYSTGMYMRLAFSVAAHLDTEILLVDEVLAVGDAEFQRKCIGRMRELSESMGRTVLFVSHNDAAIRQLCPRSVWLKSGVVEMDGQSDVVLDAYLDEQFRESVLDTWIDLQDASRGGSGEVKFVDVRLEVPGRAGARTVEPGDPLRARMRVESDRDLECGIVSFYLSTLGGMKVVSAGSSDTDSPFRLRRGVTELTIDIETLHLNPGRYTGSLWISRPTGARRKFALYDHLEDAFDIVVAAPSDVSAPEGLVTTRSHVTIGGEPAVSADETGDSLVEQ